MLRKRRVPDCLGRNVTATAKAEYCPLEPSTWFYIDHERRGCSAAQLQQSLEPSKIFANADLLQDSQHNQHTGSLPRATHLHVHILANDALVLDACPLACGGAPAHDAVCNAPIVAHLHLGSIRPCYRSHSNGHS